MDEPQQIAVLRDALAERYRALAVIRERVQTVSLWVLGLMASGAGWIVVEDPSWSRLDRLLVSAAVLLVLGALRLRYFPDLQEGFTSQQRVAARIEAELGLYDEKVLGHDNGQGPIYPSDWRNAGQKEGSGRFFESNYFLLYAAVGLLLVATWITCIL